MKLNWGTGIVIAFAAFISFIMYFVITVNSDKKYDHDLVTEEYYKQELGFQKKIDEEQKTKDLHLEPLISKTNDGLIVNFSNTFNPSQVKGTVFLYRPSNKLLDFEIPISLSDSNLLIPKARLLDGRWNLEVRWDYEGESYLFKDELVY